MCPTQANRPIAVSTPLGEDVLLFQSMSGEERLGRLFEYTLELLSDDENIAIPDILGQSVTLRLALPNDETRYFNGYVSRFSQVGQSGRFVLYQATLRPWLWFLTRTSDCRIFQEQTVPDIIKAIFREYGFTDFEERLSGDYRTWEYCVQYRETDFNFVSRLMEQEGMHYFFTHEDGKHSLVLSDAYSSHQPTAGYEQIPYYPPAAAGMREEEHINDWLITQQVQPVTYSLDDFDFKRPKTDLMVRATITREHAAAEYEMYDYAGEYIETADGENYARARIEELQAQYEQVQGRGNARGLSVGALFTLSNYTREDQNREYLVVGANYALNLGVYEANTGSEGPLYAIDFTAIDAQQPYRSPRITPKPVVQGPQTAVVVGPSGEEIWTDQFGRVKVQFHWDRLGENNENSSCWIRVSQVHAGKGFGGIDTPRIGEEVIVSFLEGDPDHPIITGRVYNGDNKPPNGLPAAAMVSGLKSNSTPGGGGDNTIMLDDTAGNELITIHGQFDMDSTIDNDLREHVLNNRSRDVAADESVSIGNNQTLTISADRTKSVTANQKESIGGNKTIAVTGNHEETISGNKTIAVTGNHEEAITGSMKQNVSSTKSEHVTLAKDLFVGAAYQVTVIGLMNESIGAAKMEEIGGAKIVGVAGLSKESVGVSKSVGAGTSITETAGTSISNSAGTTFTAKAGSDFSGSAGGKMSLSSDGDMSASSKAKVLIKAASELTLKCGSASITMKDDGTITIKGKDIKIDGSGKINIKAGGDIVMKGSNILQN